MKQLINLEIGLEDLMTIKKGEQIQYSELNAKLSNTIESKEK